VSRTVLLVHSSGPQGPGQGSEPFAARLREELGPDYEVLFPLMPEPHEPHYVPWSERLGEILNELDGRVVLVGHSLGGSVALRHLAETGDWERIAGLVLVATPFWGTSDWEAEWALPEGWPDEATELPATYLFHSRDDEEIPITHLDRYSERLPDATARSLDGNGHLFDRGDLSQILDAIRTLAES
jgi:predicted alpha/beta hydrolase family esterase